MKSLIIFAYFVASLDTIITAYGITFQYGHEGNPLFNWIPYEPHQFVLMAVLNITAFWFMYLLIAINDTARFLPRKVYMVMPDAMLMVIFIRAFCVFSWITGTEMIHGLLRF